MTTPKEARARFLAALDAYGADILPDPIAAHGEVVAAADAYAKLRALEAHDEECERCSPVLEEIGEISERHLCPKRRRIEEGD